MTDVHLAPVARSGMARDTEPVMSRRALVRAPGPRLHDGLVTHVQRQPVDLDRAHRQWHAYVAAFVSAGWALTEVEPADDCPDAVFVEDTVVVYGDLAVICRPGALSRRAETAAVEVAVRGQGYRVAHIESPGTLDGGDVLKWGGQVWVGRGGRTNAAGIEQLAGHLAEFGATVVPVTTTKVLHLKSAVSALPDGTVLGYLPAVDDPSIYPRFLAVPEEPGAHVVLLDEDRVLMAANAPRTAALLRDRGLHVVSVDIGEFEKLEGCVTCLSVRLRA